MKQRLQGLIVIADQFGVTGGCRLRGSLRWSLHEHDERMLWGLVPPSLTDAEAI